MKNAGEELHYAIGQSKLGLILVAVSTRGLSAVLLGQSEAELMDELRESFPFTRPIPSDAATKKILKQILAFAEDPRKKLDVVLDEHGTPFQKKVWAAVRSIPSGSTASYSEIAVMIKAPKAFRAVASACKANRHALITPCHRIIRSDGTFCGYRWGGILQKEEILNKEKKLK